MDSSNSQTRRDYVNFRRDYRGYLSPYAADILARMKRGESNRQIAEALYARGVRPPNYPERQPEQELDQSYYDAREVAAIAGSINNLRGALPISFSAAARKRIPFFMWVNAPGWQVWTPEKQWREFQTELLGDGGWASTPS